MISGVAVFRLYKYHQIVEQAYVTGNMNPYSLGHKAFANKEILSDLAVFLEPLDPETWAKRIETNTIDLYTNDKEMYRSVISKFSAHVVHNFEPEEADIATLENSGSIIVKKYPHGKYKFKVYLLPHKISDKEEKKYFLDWVDTQGTRVIISEAVKKWFIDTAWNWDRRYVLVEDEQSLLMLKLRAGSAIGRVYDYVIRDK
jgi:hypothetical protein